MKLPAAIFVLMLTACATAMPPMPDGVFGDVRMSAETGDLGGFQMETHLDGPHPTVVFTTCEGGCYGGKSWPAALSNGTISFSVVDNWYGADGQLSQQDTTRYLAQRHGDAWILTSLDRPELRARLRRLPNAAAGDTEQLAHF